jgi:hypothetical protein
VYINLDTGEWVSEHPDTQVRFEGKKIPEWSSIIDICKRAASAFSGVRLVGWDVALTPEGPILIEGNATWGLPVVQVHSQGYLQEPIRKQLSEVGAQFPEHLRPIPLALLALLIYQWRRSKAPRVLQEMPKQFKRFYMN